MWRQIELSIPKINTRTHLKGQNPVCSLARGLSTELTPRVSNPIVAKNITEPKDNRSTAKSPQVPASEHPLAGPKSSALPP